MEEVKLCVVGGWEWAGGHWPKGEREKSSCRDIWPLTRWSHRCHREAVLYKDSKASRKDQVDLHLEIPRVAAYTRVLCQTQSNSVPVNSVQCLGRNTNYNAKAGCVGKETETESS